ncbi:MAG: hypothetical protein ACFFC7_06675 [Candidatus Hermodarchaeota archaeon]
MIRASILRKRENENDDEEKQLSPSFKHFNSPPSLPPRSQLLKIVTSYLTELLPLKTSNNWSRRVIWKHLQQSYAILPRNRLVIPNRKRAQIQLYTQCPSLPNPMPHTTVSNLSQLIQCQANRDAPIPERLNEGKQFHEHLQLRFETKDLLAVHTSALDKILADISLQTREQTLTDPALNLSGRVDHLLLTSEGFVIREDKQTVQPWNPHYQSAIFQVHVYAFILQAMYPNLPCRALQICVYIRAEENCQLYTFAPAWKWFLPLFAHTLLHQWGLPKELTCSTKCEGKGNCSLIPTFPLEIACELIPRDEIDQIAAERKSDYR